MTNKDTESNSPINEEKTFQLFDELRPRLLKHVLRHSGFSGVIDEEDIVQSVFIDLYRQIKEGKVGIEDDNIYRLAFHLAKHRVVDHVRNRSRLKRSSSETDFKPLPELNPSPLNESLSDELDDSYAFFSEIESKTKHFHAVEPQQLSVFVDPGDAPPELIAELYASIDALYRSCGGSGLKVAREERRTFVGELL